MSASVMRTSGVTPVLSCQRPNNTYCAAARLSFRVWRRAIHCDYTLTVPADTGPFLMLFSETPHTRTPPVGPVTEHYRAINTNHHSAPSMARYESNMTHLRLCSSHHNMCKASRPPRSLPLAPSDKLEHTQTFRGAQLRLRLLPARLLLIHCHLRVEVGGCVQGC